MEDNNQEALSNENNANVTVDKGTTEDPKPVESEPTDPASKATDKTGEEGKGKVEQISLEEHQKLQESFKEAQRKITELGQDRANIRSQYETLNSAIGKLQEQIAVATKKPPPSPEQLIREIESKGIEALQPFINEPINSLKEQHSKELATRDETILKLQVDTARIIRQNDPENYPNFKKFWPEIQALSQDPDTPVDFSKDINVVMDALYKLVQTKHSKEAILEAERLAKEKAEAGLANEAETHVAGGGKKVGKSTPNLKGIKTAAELRKVVANMHGVADEDR